MTQSLDSVRGKGKELLLPERGNPFRLHEEPNPAAAYGEESLTGTERWLLRVAAGSDPAPEPLAPLPLPSRAPSVEKSTPQDVVPEQPLSAAEYAARYPSDRSVRDQLPTPPIRELLPATGSLTDRASGAFPAPIPQPSYAPIPAPEPVRAHTPPQPAAKPDYARILVDDNALRKLWNSLEGLEKLILRSRTAKPEETEANLHRVQAARDLLQRGPEQFGEVGRMVAEMEAGLAYHSRVRRWSYSWGLLLAASTLFWLLLVALGLFATFYFPFPADFVSGFPLQLLAFSVLCGALGGVTNSLRSLILHIAIEQNFDPQQSIWYWFSPLLGGILSLLIFFGYVVGVMVFAQGGTSSSPTTLAWVVVGILAFLVGFQQNTAYRWVEKTLRATFR